MDEWGIDLLCTGSQKCLGSLAGLAPVGVADRMWDLFDRRSTAPQSYMFDLSRWRLMWFPKEEGGLLKFGYRRQPMTMATHLVYALDEAVRIILAEGVENRCRRHAAASRALRAALPHLGLKLFPEESCVSPTTTAAIPPDGIGESAVRRLMRERFGIFCAGGLEEFHGKMLRIGHMAVTASYEYIIPTISALELTMKELGVPVETGKAVSAAQEVFGKNEP